MPHSVAKALIALSYFLVHSSRLPRQFVDLQGLLLCLRVSVTNDGSERAEGVGERFEKMDLAPLVIVSMNLREKGVELKVGLHRLRPVHCL